MSQEIINFNQEKYEFLTTKIKTHKIYGKTTTNLTKAKKFAYLNSPNLATIEHGSKSPQISKDTRFPPNNFIHKAKWLKITMAQNESKVEARA